MKHPSGNQSQEVLAGLVERVTYHNAENGFCVLRAKAGGHRDVVIGTPMIASMSMLRCSAKTISPTRLWICLAISEP